jgi:hypothetical protein
MTQNIWIVSQGYMWENCITTGKYTNHEAALAHQKVVLDNPNPYKRPESASDRSRVYEETSPGLWVLKRNGRFIAVHNKCVCSDEVDIVLETVQSEQAILDATAQITVQTSAGTYSDAGGLTPWM